MKKSFKLITKEKHTAYHGLYFKIKRVLYSEESPFQKIEVVENEFFGKILFLDNLVQTTEKDEFFYHEMLTHPALVTHPSPKNVLIIGGGDGGALRETLRYPIKKTVLVEIDKKVIEVSKKFFPQMARSFEDKRVEIVIANGSDYVKNLKEKFDIIIVDSSDPVGPSKALFKKEFYQLLKSRINNEGIITAQTGSAFYHLEKIKEINNFLKETFSIVRFYTCPVPTYPSGIWSFVFLSEKINPLNIKREPPEVLKYFNIDVHRASFSLPNFLKNILS